jgi:hypothetical protein
MVAHLLYGSLVAIVYAVHATAVPLDDWTIQSTFGWDEVAAQIRTLEQSHDVGFVAATRYTTAAQLGFAMHDPDVVAIAARHDQYDYWFDPAAHEGEDAIVATDALLGLGGVTPHFESLTPLESVTIERFGQVVYRVDLYLGHRFRATPAQ